MFEIILIVMIVILLLGFPMKISLIAAPLLMTMFFIRPDPTNMISQMLTGITPFVLLAVPMFILAADIMSKGHTSNRLLDFVGSFVGHIRGGYAITTAATCTLFGSISGSTQATVVAVGTPMRQRLLKAGYKDSSAIALIINSSDVALLIPPSIGMIIYGVASNTSVGDLFIAGILPGVLIFLCFAIYSYWYAYYTGIPREPKASWSVRFLATRKALLPLGFPIIIVGGLYDGATPWRDGAMFTPTEAAAICVLYAFILEVLVFRSVKIKDLPGIALSTGLVTSAVFILVAAGQAFSWVISYERIPQMLIENVFGSDPSALFILMIVAIAFFIGCMFVDPIVVIFILTPIFYPVAMSAGIDPVHLGVVIVLQAAIGSATPPFGVDIFTASAVFNKQYLDVIKGTPPFVIILMIVSVLVILFEEISLFLLHLF